MEKQSEVLKNNSHHLKTCILYEVLQKKPVEESYRSFCKAIGDGVMDYSDFEYWFYRFYNGNCDFDHDRSQDSKQKTLVELPVEVLRMITEQIEPMERVSFSMVSKVIKGICDITPTKLKDVYISLINNCFSIVLDTMTIEYSGGVGVPNTLKINNEPKKEIQGNFIMAGRETTRRVLAMPHLQIEHFSLYASERSIELLLPNNLHVKSATIRDREANVVFGILEHLQSGTLKRIKLNSFYPPTSLALLLESKHFLEANEVDIVSFGVVTSMEELRKFRHLARFAVSFGNITPELAGGIQDMLSTSKVFKSCGIACENLNVFGICRALGANVSIEPNEFICATHRTRIEGSSNFLEFMILRGSIRVEKVN